MICSYYVNGNAVKKQFFHRYSNKLTKIKALSKKLYLITEIEENKYVKKQWKILRTVWPNKKNFDAPSELKLDDSNITHKPKKMLINSNNIFV